LQTGYLFSACREAAFFAGNGNQKKGCVAHVKFLTRDAPHRSGCAWLGHFPLPTLVATRDMRLWHVCIPHTTWHRLGKAVQTRRYCWHLTPVTNRIRLRLVFDIYPICDLRGASW
jgi:hypothetical protein